MYVRTERHSHRQAALLLGGTPVKDVKGGGRPGIKREGGK